VFFVQPFRDPRQTLARGAQFEDPADHCGFGVVDAPFDVRPLARGEDFDVVVPEDAPAGDVARFRLALHGVVRALPRLLPLEFISERRQAEHDLVCRAIQRAFPIFKVEEHPNARLDELLERVGRLDRFPAKPRFLRHDKHLERRSRLQRIHQPEKAGPFVNSAPEIPSST
jgi:hypothetical protein